MKLVKIKGLKGQEVASEIAPMPQKDQQQLSLGESYRRSIRKYLNEKSGVTRGSVGGSASSAVGGATAAAGESAGSLSGEYTGQYSGGYPKANVETLEKEMNAAGITNKFIKIAMLSVMAKESGLKPKSETPYNKTSLSRIKQIWPWLGKKYSDGELESLKKSTSPSDGNKKPGLGLFDLVYAGKYGNGNKASGDGSRYRGRGFNQVTFKSSYKKRGKEAGVDLVSNPDSLNEVPIAAKVGVSFLVTRLKNHAPDYNNTTSQDQANTLVAKANAGWGKGGSALQRALSSTKERNPHFAQLYSDTPAAKPPGEEKVADEPETKSMTESFENFISDYIINEKSGVTRGSVGGGSHSGGGYKSSVSSAEPAQNVSAQKYGTNPSIKVDPSWSWEKKTLVGVIARGGKSKWFDHLIALDGGTVGIAHFAAGGMNSLYDAMGDALAQKYFNKTVDELKKIDCRGTTPSGKNDNGTGCYSKPWWKNGMLAFLKDPASEKIQTSAWNKNYGEKSKEYVKGKPGWDTERAWSIAAGIKNSAGTGGLNTHTKHGNVDPESALVSYVGNNSHRKRRAQAINTVFPLHAGTPAPSATLAEKKALDKLRRQVRKLIIEKSGVTRGSVGGSSSGSSSSSGTPKTAEKDTIPSNPTGTPGLGVKNIEDIKNPKTHWNFKIDDPKPSDWNITNFSPKDIMSKGNSMVVADKNALRSLDKAASRASQYGHPAIKLTNMVASARNGAYRDPASNAKQGGAKNSRHQYGDGFDIWTRGWTEIQRKGILRNLYDIGFRAFGHGANNIHADMRPGKRIVQWKYGSYSIPPKSMYTAGSKTAIAESFENFISDYIINEKSGVTRGSVGGGYSGGGGSTSTSSDEKSVEQTPLDVKKGVGGKVNWGNAEQSPATSAAWNYLRPFLPKGTSLNSVMRGQESQDRIARNMSKKRGYSGDLDGAYKFLKSKGVAIARRVGVGHGGKNGSAAFDLSSKAGLDAIADSLTKVINDPVMSKYVKFQPIGNKSPPYSLIERKNGAVHVLFYLKDVKVPYDPSAVGQSSLPKTEVGSTKTKKKST